MSDLKNQIDAIRIVHEKLYTSNKITPLGLIINEIASNAIKHGFSGTKKPFFKVEMEKNKGEDAYVLPTIRFPLEV